MLYRKNINMYRLPLALKTMSEVIGFDAALEDFVFSR